MFDFYLVHFLPVRPDSSCFRTRKIGCIRQHNLFCFEKSADSVVARFMLGRRLISFHHTTEFFSRQSCNIRIRKRDRLLYKQRKQHIRGLEATKNILSQTKASICTHRTFPPSCCALDLRPLLGFLLVLAVSSSSGGGGEEKVERVRCFFQFGQPIHQLLHKTVGLPVRRVALCLEFCLLEILSFGRWSNGR